MALVFASTSAPGRQRWESNLVANQAYILLFPDKALSEVRYEGVWELLRFNTPLSRYVQVLVVPCWVDSHFIAGANIPNVNHRFSWVWRREGVDFEVHTA